MRNARKGIDARFVLGTDRESVCSRYPVEDRSLPIGLLSDRGTDSCDEQEFFCALGAEFTNAGLEERAAKGSAEGRRNGHEKRKQ